MNGTVTDVLLSSQIRDTRVEDSWVWLGIGGGGGNVPEGWVLLPELANKQPPLSLWSLRGGSGGATDDRTCLLDVFGGICTIEFELDGKEEVVATFEDNPACDIVILITLLTELELEDDVACELVLLENLAASFAFMDGLSLGEELFLLFIWNYRIS